MSRWLLFAALGGCGATSPSPSTAPALATAPRDAKPIDAAALDDDLPRLASRSVQLYQDLATAVSTGDCPQVTAKVDAMVATYADVIAANARVLHAGPAKMSALEQALATRQNELGAAAAAVSNAPAVAQCAQDPGFGAAIDRLVGAP